MGVAVVRWLLGEGSECVELSALLDDELGGDDLSTVSVVDTVAGAQLARVNTPSNKTRIRTMTLKYSRAHS